MFYATTPDKTPGHKPQDRSTREASPEGDTAGRVIVREAVSKQWKGNGEKEAGESKNAF